MVNNSRNAVEKLREYLALGEKVLKTAELCRRLETEKEKVIPFYEASTEDEEEAPATICTEMSLEEVEEYRYLNNFYKRHNKVLLDKLVALYLCRLLKSRRRRSRGTTRCSSRC